MKNKIYQLFVWGFLLLVFIDFTNGVVYLLEKNTSLAQPDYNKFYIFFLLLHVPLIVYFLGLVRGDLRKQANESILKSIWLKTKAAGIPTSLRIIATIIIVGNIVSISLGKPCYPFYDVGMFRWPGNFENAPKIVYKPKYFFFHEGKPRILDLRREGFIFFSEYFGPTYTHMFTFATNYHNKARKETFDYLSEKMSARGIDTLWVGVQTVDYETGVVTFNTDLCNAVMVNQTKNIHYGPIYIPSYQIQKCINQ